MIKLINMWPIFLLLLVACGDKQEKLDNRSDQYLKSAEQLSAQGQLRAAVIQAKNAIQIVPDSELGYLQIAKIYNQIGYYTEVEKLLADKLVRQPGLRYEMAVAYFQRKKYRTALGVLEEFNGPRDQSFYLLKSLIHLHLDQMNECEAEIKAIAMISETDGYWLFARAKAARVKGRWAEAESLLTQVSADSRVYIDSIILLAEGYIQSAQVDLAEKQLTAALSKTLNADALTVEKAKILTMLVELLVQQGRSGEAYAYQKLMANANPQLDSMRSRFDAAVALYAKGDVEQAKNQLSELHQAFPNNSNVTSLLGVIAFQQGRDDEAEAYLSQVIDPETATLGLIQTSSLLKARNNKIDEAIALLRESVNSQPKNAQLLATYGLALLQKNPVDKEGALALEKSVAMDATQQRLRLALAERHYRLEEKEQALAQLETAFKYEPLDRVITQAYFSRLATISSNKTVAIKIQQLKEKFPKHFQVALIEAWWLVEQKHYVEADELLRSADIAGLPVKEKMDVYGLLLRLHLKQDKREPARKLLEDMLRLSPQSSQFYLTWFDLLVEQDIAQAIVFLNELQQVDESVWQPHYYLALLHQKLQKWSDVEQSLAHVLQKSSQENVRQQVIKLYNARGFQLFRAGEFNQAQSVFIKSLGIDSVDRTALYYYVQIALRHDQVTQAKTLLAAADQNKKLAIHWFLSGLINEKENRMTEALQDFQEAWKQEPFDLYAEKLYSLYQAQKKSQLLAGLIQEWYQRLPESTQALLLMAMLQQEQGQTKSAVESYEKILSKQPDHLIAMNNLAWLYLDVDSQKAEALAEKAFKLAPASADIVDTYAWVLFKQHKLKQSLAVANEAAGLAPDNATIKEHLDVIRRASEQ